MINRQGINKWRDSALPKEILAEYCLAMNFEEPKWVTSTEVVVDGTTYTLKQFGKERGGGRCGFAGKRKK